MQQFAALGYIEDPGADKEKAAESAEIEAKYNVARTYLWKGQSDKARPLLEEVVRRRPWEDRFLMQLAPCYFQAGYLAQAERVLCAIADGGEPDTAATKLLWARIKLAARRSRRRFACLARDRSDESAIAGNLHSDRRHLCTSAAVAERQKSPTKKRSLWTWTTRAPFLGLSTVYRRLGDNQQTVDHALRAVSLLHRLPLAHFNLGVALVRSGDNRTRPAGLRNGASLSTGDGECASLSRDDSQDGRRRSGESRSFIAPKSCV